jgi:hypothetical protein
MHNKDSHKSAEYTFRVFFLGTFFVPITPRALHTHSPYHAFPGLADIMATFQIFFGHSPRSLHCATIRWVPNVSCTLDMYQEALEYSSHAFKGQPSSQA